MKTTFETALLFVGYSIILFYLGAFCYHLYNKKSNNNIKDSTNYHREADEDLGERKRNNLSKM